MVLEVTTVFCILLCFDVNPVRLIKTNNFRSVNLQDLICLLNYNLSCRFIQEYRIDVSKLEPLVAKVCKHFTESFFLILVVILHLESHLQQHEA